MIIGTPTGAIRLARTQAAVGSNHDDIDDLYDDLMDDEGAEYWKQRYKEEKELRKSYQKTAESLNRSVRELTALLDEQEEERNVRIQRDYDESMRNLAYLNSVLDNTPTASDTLDEPRRPEGRFNTGYRLTMAKGQKPSLTRLDGKGDSLIRDIYDGVELDISPGHGFTIRPHRKG